MRQLRLTTFGGLHFHIDDREIGFSTRKTAALIVYLAMHAGRRLRAKHCVVFCGAIEPRTRPGISLSRLPCRRFANRLAVIWYTDRTDAWCGSTPVRCGSTLSS